MEVITNINSNSTFKKSLLLMLINFKIILKKPVFWILIFSFLIINFIFLLLTVLKIKLISPGLDDIFLYKMLSFIICTFIFSIITVFISSFYFKTHVNEEIIFIESRSGIKIKYIFLMRYLSCLIILFLISIIHMAITLIFLGFGEINQAYKTSIYLSWAFFYFFFSIIVFNVIQLIIISFKQLEGAIFSFIICVIYAISPSFTMLFTLTGGQIGGALDNHDSFLYRIQTSQKFYQEIYQDKEYQKYFQKEEFAPIYYDYLKNNRYKEDFNRVIFNGQINYFSNTNKVKDLKIMKIFNDILELFFEGKNPPKPINNNWDKKENAWLFYYSGYNKHYYYELEIDYILDYISTSLPEYQKLINYIRDIYELLNLNIARNTILSDKQHSFLFDFNTYNKKSGNTINAQQSDDTRGLLVCHETECLIENKDLEKQIKKVNNVYANYPEIMIINWIIIQSWIKLFHLNLIEFAGRDLYSPEYYLETLETSFSYNSKYIPGHFYSLYMTFPGNNIVNDKFRVNDSFLTHNLYWTYGLDSNSIYSLAAIENQNTVYLQDKQKIDKIEPIFDKVKSLKYQKQLSGFIVGFLYILGYVWFGLLTYYIFKRKNYF